MDNTQETFTLAPPYAPRTSAQTIIDAIDVKARLLELQEAEPWKKIEVGRWGPTNVDSYPAEIKAALEKGVRST